MEKPPKRQKEGNEAVRIATQLSRISNQERKERAAIREQWRRQSIRIWHECHVTAGWVRTQGVDSDSSERKEHYTSEETEVNITQYSQQNAPNDSISRKETQESTHMRSQTEWQKAFSESEAVMREFILDMRREQLEILARQKVEGKKWAKEREERRQTEEESAKLDAVEARLQQTHYEALGVAPTANATQIRTHRKLLNAILISSRSMLNVPHNFSRSYRKYKKL